MTILLLSSLKTAALAIAAAVTLQATTGAAQAGGPVRTVPAVDLNRYLGDWFEIARFPNRFQQQCVGDVRATYARRADGRLDVVNQCRTEDGTTEARGIARIVDERTFARLKVRFAPAWLSFLPFVWGDYWIIGLAEDYSWALVGSPDRKYLWILARSPRLDDEAAAKARGIARANGFDVDRLVQTVQEGNRDSSPRTHERRTDGHRTRGLPSMPMLFVSRVVPVPSALMTKISVSSPVLGRDDMK